MARTLKSDAVLFSTTLLLLVIGMAWVYSASAAKAGASLVIKQGAFMAVGLAGAFAAMKIDYRRLCNRRMAIGVVGATAVVLVGVLLFGRTVGGGPGGLGGTAWGSSRRSSRSWSRSSSWRPSSSGGSDREALEPA